MSVSPYVGLQKILTFVYLPNFFVLPSIFLLWVFSCSTSESIIYVVFSVNISTFVLFKKKTVHIFFQMRNIFYLILNFLLKSAHSMNNRLLDLQTRVPKVQNVFFSYKIFLLIFKMAYNKNTEYLLFFIWLSSYVKTVFFFKYVYWPYLLLLLCVCSRTCEISPMYTQYLNKT